MDVDTESIEKEKWYSRPIFSVSDFEQTWKYEEKGQTIVTQVDKGEFELILAANLGRVGQARVFISLNTTELEKLERRIKEKKIAVERVHWGYPAIQVRDPDGNELLFPLVIEG